MKNEKVIIEYSLVGNDIEEHFSNYEDAERECKSYPIDYQMDFQFFSKEWINGSEGEVVIFKNYGEHL